MLDHKRKIINVEALTYTRGEYFIYKHTRSIVLIDIVLVLTCSYNILEVHCGGCVLFLDKYNTSTLCCLKRIP